MVQANQESTHGVLRTLLTAAALVLAYVVTGRLGMDLARIDNAGSLLWPPTGIATALLFYHGVRLAPFVFLAAVLVNFRQQHWPIAIGIAIGNMAAPVLAAFWLKEWRLSPRFNRRRDAQTLLTIAALTMTVSALNGTVWLAGAGRIARSQFLETFGAWYFGDLSGVLILAPLLLAWPDFVQHGFASRRQIALLLLETLALIALLLVIFTGIFATGYWMLALAFIPFIAVIRVAALRGIWPASLQLLIVIGFVMYSLLHNVGPLHFLPPETRIHVVWGYLTALAIASLMTSGIIGDCESAEKQLQAGDANYKVLVEDNPALICRFHVDGWLAFANETFRRTFGVDTGMTAGENFYSLSGLANVPDFLDRLQQSRFGDPAVTADCRMELGSGEHWFRWSARVVQESSGQGIEFHAVGLDISAQIRAEAERRQIERQAVQHQKLETVGALAGGIAHEFNNLLTAVLGNAELAEMMLPSNSQVVPLLADVRTGARRAAELSQQLLNYSIRGSLGNGPLDLSEAIRSVRDLISVAVPKRCRMEVELAEGLPLIAADESRVRQLLMSIVLNAGEAASETGGPVILRTRCVHFDPKSASRWRLLGDIPAGWYVMLQIEDRGHGMSEDARSRLCQPFFSTKFPGRGLGLAAVLGIVKDYGGGLGVCSREGLGTCISVLFPPLDPAGAVLGRPGDHPAHSAGCIYCETDDAESHSREAAVARPPLSHFGHRSGWSSHVRSRSRRVNLGEQN